MLQSSKHLLSLINDILDLSKVEAGKQELQLTDVSLKDLLERSLIMFREKTLKHGMQLAAISGVNGVYSDEDIERVRELALEARKTWKPPSAASVQKKPRPRTRKAS